MAETGGRGDTRALWAAIVVLAVAVVAVAVLALGDDDEDDDRPARATTTEQPATSTTSPPSSTSATTPPVEVDRATAVWPWEAGEGLDDPVDAAAAYAEDHLGFTAPVVGDFQEGDSRSGEVEVRPAANGPVTTIFVRQLAGEDTWSVLGAATADIELTVPEAGAAIASPVTLSGEALAFEGTVGVEIRQDGSSEAIGDGFVTGGGDEMRPFTGSIEFDEPTAEYGTIVLLIRSAEDGSVWQAAALRVRFDR